MKTESKNLTGNALIWAVCQSVGHSPVITVKGISYKSDNGSWVYPRYMDDCEVGGLMASELISAERPSKGQSTPVWRAVTDSKLAVKPHIINNVACAFGNTLGEAVCRALVLSHHGEHIVVPDLLSYDSKAKEVVPLD